MSSVRPRNRGEQQPLGVSAAADRGTTVRLRFDGALDATTRAAFLRNIEHHAMSGVRCLVVDIDDLEVTDDAGLAALEAARYGLADLGRVLIWSCDPMERVPRADPAPIPDRRVIAGHGLGTIRRHRARWSRPGG